MSGKHIKRCPAPLYIREMHINIFRNIMFYFSEENCTKQLKLKCTNLTIPDASKNTRKVGLSYIAHCWWTENDPAAQGTV